MLLGCSKCLAVCDRVKRPKANAAKSLEKPCSSRLLQGGSGDREVGPGADVVPESAPRSRMGLFYWMPWPDHFGAVRVFPSCCHTCLLAPLARLFDVYADKCFAEASQPSSVSARFENVIPPVETHTARKASVSRLHSLLRCS